MTTEEHPNQYIFDHTINSEREAYLTNQLVAFNQANTGALPLEPVAPLPMQISILDASGRVLGGLIGRTHSIPQWLEISIIWIEESGRRAGLGRRLMEEAENEASRRGCRYARVSTSDFQAPGFYQKLGYVTYGTLENCPPGETAYYLWKQLDRREPARADESPRTVEGGLVP
jgi:ribosomal protein S18 acetylase RimI-like enzyme